MDFFDTVSARRSIRKYRSDPIPEAVMRKALEAAILAPNSSNLQTWNFYWARSEAARSELVRACLSQSAARTAAELVVVTADPSLWRRSNPKMVEFTRNISAPKVVQLYYSKLIPVTYRWGFLNCLVPFKWLTSTLTGLFRPMMRGPLSRRDLQEVAIKSAALASENFVLAMAAQGYATCMMEGFDERRVARLLRLPSSARVVMVISAGVEGERGTWGPRFRLPVASVVHEI
jgi:nitroreductase